MYDEQQVRLLIQAEIPAVDPDVSVHIISGITVARVGRTDCWVGRINYPDGSFTIVEGQGTTVTQVIAGLNKRTNWRYQSPVGSAHEQRQRQVQMAERQQHEVERQKALIEAHRRELDIQFDGDLFEERPG